MRAPIDDGSLLAAAKAPTRANESRYARCSNDGSLLGMQLAKSVASEREMGSDPISLALRDARSATYLGAVGKAAR